MSAQLTRVAPTLIARRLGCVPVNQASPGQRSTAPTTPPVSIATAMSQIAVGTITQLISSGAEEVCVNQSGSAPTVTRLG